MSVAKQELKKVVNELSDDESRIVLKFAEWLREQKEELTEAELAILRKGEQRSATAISSGGVMSNEQIFKIALSKEALKYYNKVSVNTAARLDKSFTGLESDPVKVLA